MSSIYDSCSYMKLLNSRVCHGDLAGKCWDIKFGVLALLGLRVHFLSALSIPSLPSFQHFALGGIGMVFQASII